MKGRTARLRESLPAICRAMTREKGITLIFQGPPRTDGRVIYSNPLPIEADEDQVKMIIGDIDHECGHILFTDFDFHRDRLTQEPVERRPLLKALANAIEDTMVERRMGERYLGCRVTLAESVELLEKTVTDFVAPTDPGKCLANFIDCWGRVHVLRQRLDKSLGIACAAIDDLLGKGARSKLEGLLTQHLYSVSSTQDTWELAKRVVRFLETVEDETREDKPLKSPGPGQDARPSTTMDKDDGSAGPESEGTQDGTPSPEAGSGAQHPGAKAILASKPEAKPLFDRREEADNAIAEAAEAHYVPYGADGGLDDVDVAAGGYGGRLQIMEQPGQYERLRSTVAGQVQELVRRIVQDYQAAVRDRWHIAESGRIDSRRLTKGYLGDRCIYRSRTRRQLPKPAVGLVIDGSYSMAGRALTLALQSAIVLAETNQIIDVPTGIHAFSGDQVVQLKGYDQPLVQVRGRLAGLQASGGTPMEDALWRAGCTIARQRVERKLLFLITDGVPNDPAATEEISNMLQRSGIEVYGIGIDTDAVTRYVGHAAVVKDAADVSSAILSALCVSLTRAA